jgi:hypothetical protein
MEAPMRAEFPSPKQALMVVLTAALVVLPVSGSGPADLVRGQSIYVPVYSHIYHGARATPFNLACTLSIRNIDLAAPITVLSADYYDTGGKLIRRYVDKPVRVNALGTLEFYIEEKDTKGGSGANFVVRWSSEKPVNPPLVEAVMIGVEAAQGISFTSRGQVVLEAK